MGNICRSPFAEKVTERLLAQRFGANATVRSAGIHVTNATSPPKEAIAAARTFGISMNDHRAQRLTEEMVGGAEMIVVMEAKHIQEVEAISGESRGRCFLLPIFSDNRHGWGNYYAQYNIADPYGKGDEQFVSCYETIRSCVANLLSGIYIK